MSNTSVFSSDFIEKAEAIILENISNEQFGVSELAEAMNMSRSSLLRKIKTHTQLSASQFIRQVRLIKGMEMLKCIFRPKVYTPFQAKFTPYSGVKLTPYSG